MRTGWFVGGRAPKKCRHWLHKTHALIRASRERDAHNVYEKFGAYSLDLDHSVGARNALATC